MKRTEPKVLRQTHLKYVFAASKASKRNPPFKNINFGVIQINSIRILRNIIIINKISEKNTFDVIFFTLIYTFRITFYFREKKNAKTICYK